MVKQGPKPQVLPGMTLSHLHHNCIVSCVDRSRKVQCHGEGIGSEWPQYSLRHLQLGSGFSLDLGAFCWQLLENHGRHHRQLQFGKFGLPSVNPLRPHPAFSFKAPLIIFYAGQATADTVVP